MPLLVSGPSFQAEPLRRLRRVVASRPPQVTAPARKADTTSPARRSGPAGGQRAPSRPGYRSDRPVC
jgi:hypothetical protein